MDTILLVTFNQDEYKKHRENVLLDREKSRLPAAQLVIERYKEADERLPNITALDKEIAKLRAEMQTLEYKRGVEYMIIANLRSGRTADGGTKEATERRAFVMPCPAPSCRGFLSTAYKCGVCDVFCCTQCHEVKGLDRDTPHTCNPNTLATVQALKKECRPCPECGANIFKIEGCDQMFCTACNTPFSWKTGQKVTNGVIHNPHYYEYLRKMNGGVMPRAPGDIPCGGNLPQAYQFETMIQRTYGGKGYTTKDGGKRTIVTDTLYRALQVIAHIQHVEIPRYTNHAEDADNTEMNVEYLQKKITQERWKQLLQQKEKRRMKKDEIRQVLEALVGACVDIYTAITQGVPYAPAYGYGYRNRAHPAQPAQPQTGPSNDVMGERIETALKQMETLRSIFNEGMMDISKRYKCQVLQLVNANFARESKKYTTGRKKDTKDAKDAKDTNATLDAKVNKKIVVKTADSVSSMSDDDS